MDVFSYCWRVFSACICLNIVCIIVCQKKLAAQHAVRGKICRCVLIFLGVDILLLISKRILLRRHPRWITSFVEILYPHHKLLLTIKIFIESWVRTWSVQGASVGSNIANLSAMTGFWDAISHSLSKCTTRLPDRSDTTATGVIQIQHECNMSETRVRHKQLEQHECNTSATRVLHEQHKCYTSATRITWMQHQWKILILIATRVKTFFTPLYLLYEK